MWCGWLSHRPSACCLCECLGAGLQTAHLKAVSLPQWQGLPPSNEKLHLHWQVDQGVGGDLMRAGLTDGELVLLICGGGAAGEAAARQHIEVR